MSFEWREYIFCPSNMSKHSMEYLCFCIEHDDKPVDWGERTFRYLRWLAQVMRKHMEQPGYIDIDTEDGEKRFISWLTQYVINNDWNRRKNSTKWTVRFETKVCSCKGCPFYAFDESILAHEKDVHKCGTREFEDLPTKFIDCPLKVEAPTPHQEYSFETGV